MWACPPASSRGISSVIPLPRSNRFRVERANLDPGVHVIALAGNGTGFCGGYDLVASAEGVADDGVPEGSPLDPAVQARIHDPGGTWDPVTTSR